MINVGAGKDSVATSKQFIWTIQALDQQGHPFSDGNVNGDGVSEPAIFRIGKKEQQ
jgi:hypothetical protein